MLEPYAAHLRRGVVSFLNAHPTVQSIQNGVRGALTAGHADPVLGYLAKVFGASCTFSVAGVVLTVTCHNLNAHPNMWGDRRRQTFQLNLPLPWVAALFHARNGLWSSPPASESVHCSQLIDPVRPADAATGDQAEPTPDGPGSRPA